MAHHGGDQPDWVEIGRRADRLQADIIDQPLILSFGEIADTLDGLVRQEVDASAWSEQFIARMPVAPGLARGAAVLRRRTQVLARAHRYFVEMAPHESSILWILDAAARGGGGATR